MPGSGDRSSGQRRGLAGKIASLWVANHESGGFMLTSVNALCMIAIFGPH